ncbi:hypothetical protein, partial [Methylobacterium sp. Leaf100]|uniref:hypothetical protein n=1 Tax=Methylobacterium sp. Leaf100 TaxID=1736252 RepID=UPI001AEC4DE0
MPIRREHRYYYPIDWAELSAVIRFRRAGGACEGCGRPHQRFVYCLKDGRWWDAACGAWRDGQGRSVAVLPRLDELEGLRRTKVVLAAAHRDWSAPIEVVRSLVWLLSLEDGQDGKAPEARGD